MDYFYIKEKVDNEEIKIEHCPMGQMWKDINTKLKQALVYLKFWGHLMRILTDYNDKDYIGIIPSIPLVSLMLPVSKAQKALQECVGENQKETLLTNLKKDAPSKLLHGSILARKSYWRILADKPIGAAVSTSATATAASCQLLPAPTILVVV